MPKFNIGDKVIPNRYIRTAMHKLGWKDGYGTVIYTFSVDNNRLISVKSHNGVEVCCFEHLFEHA